MYKIIKRYGKGVVIRLTTDEMNINKWKVGDVLDMTDTVKADINKRKEVKRDGNKKRGT